MQTHEPDPKASAAASSAPESLGTDAGPRGNGHDGAAATVHEAPRIPVLPEASAAADASLVRSLLLFCRGEVEGAAALDEPGDAMLPALLHPYRDPSRVRTDYPLFLFAADAGADARLVAPLADVLSETVAAHTSDASMLKDNLVRLEVAVRERLSGVAGTPAAADVVASAATDVLDALALSPSARAQLSSQLDRLVAALPRGGTLLGSIADAPLVLFSHAARRRALVRRVALGREVGKLRQRIADLLRADHAKEGRDPRELGETVRAAHVDAAALARLLGSRRGAHGMDEARRRRLAALLETFDGWLSAEPTLMTVVSAQQAGELPPHPAAPGVRWHTTLPLAVCTEAVEAFDAQAAGYAKLFAAVRVARLELAGAYDAERHELLLRRFGFEAFTEEEIASLPPVVAIESAGRLAGAGMVALSHVLRSGRPVEVMVTVSPATTAAEPAPVRFELGYLGLCHRDVLVHQSSAARPVHLVEGFLRSIAATRPSLHVIAVGAGDGAVRVGEWLSGGAAIESRAHPVFHYDPAAGTSWARRFDFTGNPQPGDDWSAGELACRDAKGRAASLDLAFTFADFALLAGAWRGEFRVIPDEVVSETLSPLAEWLGFDAEAAAARVPFVWGVDADGRCRRLAVGRTLLAACRDRLDWWRTLQELAGARSEYVHEAVAAERERFERELVAERERLTAEKERAVAEAAAGAAEAAMRKLAETLLATDAEQIAAVVAPRAAAPASVATSHQAVAGTAATAAPSDDSPAATAAPSASPANGAADDDVAEDAWIDSVLCTSCNDCINLNGRLFVYNANKQATIGDVTAGTYAELVTAAEKCPSRCIHPGRPVNPAEPGLDELVRRAAKFH